MIELLIIADDVTGALDSASQFAKAGIAVVVYANGELPWDGLPDNVRAAVVNTDTRHASPEQAYQTTKKLAQQGNAHGVRLIMKKIDSALRGNVGAEIQAVLDAGISNRLYLLPAYPEGGRTTEKGIQYWNGVPIAETAYGKDPFNPVRSSRVADAFTTDTLEIGTEAPFAADPGIQIVDISTAEQMAKRCRSLLENGVPLLLAGCAGLACALAKNMRAEKPETMGEDFPIPQRLLIVSGSLHRVSRQQIDRARKSGIPCITLTSENKEDAAERVLRRFTVSQTVVLETSAQIVGVDERSRSSIAAHIAQVVEQVYRKSEELALAVFGGDTLLEILPRILQEGIFPRGEVVTGLPLSQATDKNGKPALLISKSGGFGSEDAVEQIIQTVFRK